MSRPGRRDSSPVAQSTRIFGPPAPAVIGTVLASFVFVIVLEFLVLISFVGQRLWNHPLMLHDLVFTLPLLGWVLVLAASIVMVARIVTTWLQLTDVGVDVHGLFRRSITMTWAEVGRVVAVQQIDRGASPAEMLERSGSPYDGVFVLDRGGRRLVNVSGRFFGFGAQHAMVERARAAGVEVRDIELITPRELHALEPHALSFIDRHPHLVLLGLAAFYVAHNVLTFVIWGL
ncbi:hypothetical protein [Brachybacterium phenoliresistens]|uniref:Uncharacterized protein n=1 Tax=Brachybacterium phenoliresistens TaxID=396014 RepID=Z9JU43_9MICO|nr:hypothetical protein [Brachybacterium phenoliresistens]EWS81895.1 hypothetical protein BF93_13765 [Brachybacterium phenoliresistens]